METSTKQTSVERTQAESLAQRILSLDDPWRHRFLTEVAGLATSTHVCTSLETVVRWLENRDVYMQTKYMLRSWSGT